MDKSCVCRNPFRGLRPGMKIPARTRRLEAEVSRYVDRSVPSTLTSFLKARESNVASVSERKKTRINETAHLQGPLRKFGKSSTASPQEDDPIESRAHRVIKTTSQPKIEHSEPPQKPSQPKVGHTESLKRRSDRHESFLSSGRQTRTAFGSGPADSNRLVDSGRPS